MYNVLKTLMEMNGKLFDELTSSYKAERQRYWALFQVPTDEYVRAVILDVALILWLWGSVGELLGAGCLAMPWGCWAQGGDRKAPAPHPAWAGDVLPPGWWNGSQLLLTVLPQVSEENGAGELFIAQQNPTNLLSSTAGSLGGRAQVTLASWDHCQASLVAVFFPSQRFSDP